MLRAFVRDHAQLWVFVQAFQWFVDLLESGAGREIVSNFPRSAES